MLRPIRHILFGYTGELAHLSGHIALLNQAQVALAEVLPPELQKNVRLGNFQNTTAVIFVKNNAVKQKLHNLQARILANLRRIFPECDALQFKISPKSFPTPYVYPKSELPKLSKKSAKALQKDFQKLPVDLREPFLKIIENLKADA